MWYRIHLSLSDITAGKMFTLQDEFSAVWTAAGAPPDAAMLAGKQDDKGEAIYLTGPAAKLAGHLLAKYGGEQCLKPTSVELSLLVGRAGFDVLQNQ